MRRDTLTLAKAADNVRAYNACEAYLQMDARAHELFQVGLPATQAQLRSQLAFIAKDYEGVRDAEAQQRVLAPGADCDQIVNTVLAQHARYAQALQAATWPCPVSDLRERTSVLFAPFHQSSRWFVWAAKSCHFWRPTAFPILDSRAAAQLSRETGIPVSEVDNTPERYVAFCQVLQMWLADKASWIDPLRDADGEHYTSDLKVWDKVLFMQNKKAPQAMHR